jgi:hypothetical protein
MCAKHRPPVLEPPLAQSAKSRRPTIGFGRVLDTLQACPPLTVVELTKLDELKSQQAHKLAPECAKARERFVAKRAKRLIDRVDNISEHEARRVIERQCAGVLLPYLELPFDDPKLKGKRVQDVLENPGKYVGETLADPFEGVRYGKGKAKIMRRADGSPWIHSFAHGRTIYDLKYDAHAVRAAVRDASRNTINQCINKPTFHAPYLRVSFRKKPRILPGSLCSESNDDLTFCTRSSLLVTTMRPTVSAFTCFHTNSSGFLSGE